MAQPATPLRAVSETESPKSDKASLPGPNWLLVQVQKLTSTLPGLLLWTFYPALVAAGTYGVAWYVGIPGLTEAATWKNMSDLRIWPVLFGALVSIVPWGHLNIKYVRQPDTKVWQLRTEVNTSIQMAYIWLMAVAYMVGTGSVYLAVIIPTIAQALDGRQSAQEAINNAAQKMRLDDDARR